MKRMAVSIVMFSAFLFFIACSADRAATISEGTYTLNREENKLPAPSVTISDGTFRFTFDILSSYANVGSYSLEGNILSLKTKDKKYRYQFKVEGHSLIFDEKNSSSVQLLDEKIEMQLKDGDILSLVS